MKQNYNEVPNIISGKDLDYLSDMFNWNYETLKKSKDFKDRASDSEIKEILKSGCELFNSNLKEILSVLSEGGSNE